MDAKLKADWVKALRSGRFKQTKLALRKKGGFCCLGVLARVAHIPIARSGTTVSESVGGDYRPIAALLGGQTMNHLMHLNDGADRTFPEIADYIESHL